MRGELSFAEIYVCKRCDDGWVSARAVLRRSSAEGLGKREYSIGTPRALCDACIYCFSQLGEGLFVCCSG